MRKLIVTTGLQWLWLSVLVVILDRLSKILAIQHLDLYQPFPIFSFFNLTLAYNKGAAFGFLHYASGWQNIFFSSLAIIVSIVILLWLYRSRSREFISNCALALIMGGALGNVWDRFLYGYVIDFFEFHLGEWHFAIFNIADSAISIGATLLFFYWLTSVSDEAT